MVPVAERMKTMRARRNARGVREIRLTAPDARSISVRTRIAGQCASLNARQEDAAMAWLEAVSEFDAPGRDAAR